MKPSTVRHTEMKRLSRPCAHHPPASRSIRPSRRALSTHRGNGGLRTDLLQILATTCARHQNSTDRVERHRMARASDLTTSSQHAHSRKGPAGNMAFVKSILQDSAIEADKSNCQIWSLLLSALEYQVHELLAMILQEAELSVNSTDSKGRAALHFAVIYDDPIATDILVHQTYINLNHLDSDGNSALLLAAKTYDGRPQRDQIIDTLISCPSIAINQRDSEGRTALWHAANTRNIALIQKLAHFPGVEFSVADKHGITPQARAVQRRSFEIVRLFEDVYLRTDQAAQ